MRILKTTIYITLLTGLVLLFSGCGIAHEASQNCGGTFKGICHGILGPDDKRIDELEERIDSIEARVSELEGDYASIANLANVLSMQLTVLQALVASNYAELLGLINDMEQQLNSLQIQANDTLIEVTQLSTEYRVTELLDPCGDASGFDEVLLRTSDGGLIAYFQQGNNRFLSVLPTGNYATTDGTGCNFTIDVNGRLCDNLGCR